ncbi:rod shape-determining protein RodA [Bacteroidia bacterium]|nr:rod shape-determining protein RodA [Bacteroidia bacterium]
MRKSNVWEEVDWFSIGLYLLFVIAGWMIIYAATYDFDRTVIFDFSQRSGMQLIWIITSIIIGFSILMIENTWYEFFALWIYILVMLLLIATIFLAPNIKGSHSWLVMGPMRVQPAEFAKFATALALAKIMSTYQFNLSQGKNMFTVAMIVLLPMALIFLQQETGSALVFLAFFLVFYREGMPGAILFTGSAAILFFILEIRYGEVMLNAATPLGEFMVLGIIILLIAVLLQIYSKKDNSLSTFAWIVLSVGIPAAIVNRFYPFNLCWAAWAALGANLVYMLVMYFKERKKCYTWIVLFVVCAVGFLYSVDYVFDNVMQSHQKTRLQVAFGMIEDPSGAGYNVNQSKIAIGSGGFVGKGFLNGTQTKLKYVPEQDTDFIFCTIGEEKGFIGSIFVLGAFLLLLYRIIYLANRQKTTFYRIYGYSVASILFFHVAVNIGMVIGIMPVIGIPLPFFSYGGSSLWAFTILLFIFLRLDASRNNRA